MSASHFTHLYDNEWWSFVHESWFHTERIIVSWNSAKGEGVRIWVIGQTSFITGIHYGMPWRRRPRERALISSPKAFSGGTWNTCHAWGYTALVLVCAWQSDTWELYICRLESMIKFNRQINYLQYIKEKYFLEWKSLTGEEQPNPILCRNRQANRRHLETASE